MRDELTYEDGRMHKREYAKQLRSSTTKQETILWQKLRRKQFLGLRFRSQVAIGPYIVDFACLRRKIIIEVDGAYHDTQKEYDTSRDLYMESLGYNVIRITNEEVDEDVEEVLQKIQRDLGL